MSTADLDPVAVLRRRLQQAREDAAAAPPVDYDDAGSRLDLDEALTVLNAACAKVTHPAVQGVARALLRVDELEVLNLVRVVVVHSHLDHPCSRCGSMDLHDLDTCAADTKERVLAAHDAASVEGGESRG